MTNRNNTVLYTGITNNLQRRVYEHKNNMGSKFTSKYNITKLVYYEVFEEDDISDDKCLIFEYPENAIIREKKIKAGSRQKKIELINSINESWDDLYTRL